MVDVFNSKKPKIADNQLFEISTDKLSYKPTEIVKLKIGSASKELFVTIAIEKDYQIVNQQIIKLTNEVKFIEIPVSEKDLGAANLHTCLGVPTPVKGVSNFFQGEVETLEETGIETHIPNLTLYGGNQDFWQHVKPHGSQKIKLINFFIVSKDLLIPSIPNPII